jgi:uncharacterized membrane protein
MSLHVCFALLAHPLSYNMTWGATLKESTEATILTELPAIFKRYRVVFSICLLCIAMMITFAFLPWMEWAIIDWV